MKHCKDIAQELKIKEEQVKATVELLDEGNTVPFIARYRKEATGELDETQIRAIEKMISRLRSLDERRQTIISTIEKEGKMTPQLKEDIEKAKTSTELEDIYLPYKPKRRTRASAAREKGLEGLAEKIVKQETSDLELEEIVRPFLNEEVPNPQEALDGACDIVAETISDRADIRKAVREKALRFGLLRCEKIKKAEDPNKVYEAYYDFRCRVDRLQSHQVLAINRGKAEKVLRVKVEIMQRDWENTILAEFRPRSESVFKEQLRQAINDAAERLLLPAIERDVNKVMKGSADARAIEVFADNLRSLLGQAPLVGHVVMGIDPAYRTGCKVAVVDATSKVLVTGTIYPHPPQNKRKEAEEALEKLIKKFNVTLLAIGNGTASRETEQLAADVIGRNPGVQYLIISEAGASVYSASQLAQAELPEMDVSIRGAVSIARRAQDPLAELVKIDPRSLGVGMYQHDVEQSELEEALDDVVESAVNHVGVDVNTASPALLAHTAGIGPRLAEKIVAYRDEHGAFKSREELLDVPGLGKKAFEQAAGFMRIRDGANPLDATGIHPESYAAAEKLLDKAKVNIKQMREEKERLAAFIEEHDEGELAEELGCGLPTLRDIAGQLSNPGRDPRQDIPAPILRSDVLTMEDLKTGMKLSGTVRNVVPFGAFVDIGVKGDGLLHRSKMPPGTAVSVGNVLKVEILKIEEERGRISLGWGE
jgi:uncharacterized protein